MSCGRALRRAGALLAECCVGRATSDGASSSGKYVGSRLFSSSSSQNGSISHFPGFRSLSEHSAWTLRQSLPHSWQSFFAVSTLKGTKSFASRAVMGEEFLKRYRPATPGLRGRVTTRRDDLHKGPPVRALSFGKRRIDGRNHHGKRTTRHRGGGHKRKYRIIDFGRGVRNMDGKIVRLEYDPNRSARIALVEYSALSKVKGDKKRDFAGGLRYIIATEDMKPGMHVSSGPDAPVKSGCALPLRHIPVGAFIHNLEVIPGGGAKLVRSAGTQAQLVGRVDDSYSAVRLPSGEVRKVHNMCYASVGRVGNIHHNNVKLGKAGANRWRGRRPSVCGVNMNAVDHPHGGGKARHGPGRPPVSKWGVLAKGGKTRRKKNPTNAFIITRRNKKQ